jgi:hypothetical protein
MARPIVFAVPSLIVFAFLAATPGAFGQATKTDKERLVGSWTEVSITAGGGGSQAQPFGPNPNGMMMVDASGHISLTTLRADLPKFQSTIALRAQQTRTRLLSKAALHILEPTLSMKLHMRLRSQ